MAGEARGSGPAVAVTAAGGWGRLGIVSSVVDPWVAGGGQAATAVSGGACISRRRSIARQKISFIGQALAKASLMRRTLTVTTAPIFNSLRRIEPAVALAISVPAKPRRRTASTST